MQSIAGYYSAQRDELVNYAYKFISDYASAEDVVQDAFLKVLCSGSLFCDITLPCLMHTVVRNLSMDRMRHRRIARVYAARVSHDGSRIVDAYAAYDAAEIGELLERGVSRLSVNRQMVYMMNMYGGKKVGEISRRLHLGNKQVEYQLAVARKEVRRYVSSQI